MFATWVVFLGALLVQSPRDTVELSLKGATVAIEYGRPSLKGRDMIAKAPVGTVWRLGADQSTTLTVDGTLVFGNMVVAKGEYSLYLQRTAESEWVLIVNTQTGQWGTEHDEKRDILAVPLKWEARDESIEQVTIELNQETEDTGILAILWGGHVLRQRFRLVRTS